MAGRCDNPCEGLLSFGTNFSDTRCVLVEIPPELDAHFVATKGETLTIKGGVVAPSKKHSSVAGYSPTTDVTICTKNATYSMRRAETTNSQLVLPRSSCTIVGQSDHHFELMRITPRLEPVHSLMSARSLSHAWAMLTSKELAERMHGKDEDDTRSTRKCGFTIPELLKRVQSSEEELVCELRRIGAMHVQDVCRDQGGLWVLLEPSLASEALNMVLASVIESGFMASSVPVHNIVSGLTDSYNPVIVRHVLMNYSDCKVRSVHLLAQDYDETGFQTAALNNAKVAKFCAAGLLRNCVRMTADEFFSEWARVLPRGIAADYCYLAGVAFQSIIGGENFVEYFPVESLPRSAYDCFSALFKAKKSWRLEEFDPFIAHLVGPNSKKVDLLKRYTRSVRESADSDVRMYVKR